MSKTLIIIAAFFGLLACKHNQAARPLFESLSPEYTGIFFNNRLTEDVQNSVIEYEYAYNGAGVGIGDINNDGLEDIFFGANTVSSSLYLNKGALQFEDITQAAGITTNAWITGVTMVDINHDGWLDIYLCVAGNSENANRANLLYINNQDLTFTESAASYGIADNSFSTQAAFFDFDRDGFLDLYLMNHSNGDNNVSHLMPINKAGTARSTDKLYRNLGNGKFENVSSLAGITVEGYGLGLIIQDFNDDGWPDIFVANDYIYNDLLYINNQDGTFTDKASSYFPYNSQFAMGVDVGDINNDGFLDLMELDMLPPDNKRKKLLAGPPNYKRFQMASQLGYTNQFMRNTLYLGNANHHFNEIGIYAGVAATDWSWSVLLQDFDNDGQEDIHITNGYLKNITDLDFAIYSSQQKGARVNEGTSRENIKKAILNLDGSKLSNYIFQNNGNLTFKDRSTDWGIGKPSFSNGAAYADLDNDGDLELVVSNINDPAFIYKNNAQAGRSLSITLAGDEHNPFGEGAKILIETYSGKRKVRTKTSTRGYLSSCSQQVHFGIGESDSAKSAIVLWPDGTRKVYNLGEKKSGQPGILLRYDEGKIQNDEMTDKRPRFEYTLSRHGKLKPSFVQNKNRINDFDYQILLPKSYSATGPYYTYGDIDQDGLLDLYFGGNGQQPGFIARQNNQGTFDVLQELETGYFDRSSHFLDVNEDGFLDLIVISGGYHLFPNNYKLSNRLYLNNGNGNFTRDFNLLPKIQENQSCIAINDFDQNGTPDIFIGGHVYPMKFPLPAKSSLLVLRDGKYVDIAPEIEGLERVGIVNDATWADLDNDGWQDLIIVGEWMEPAFYRNMNGKLHPWDIETGHLPLSGHWNVIKAHDFDGDSNMDFFLGNIGTNSALSGTADAPVKVFAKDFDNNGSIDPIVTFRKDHIDYPFAARDLYIQQLPHLRKSFVDYKSFSEATFNDLFDGSALKESYEVEINHSESIMLKNLGKAKFEVKRLPAEINLNWVQDVLIEDINHDGKADLLIIGNQQNMEVSFGHVVGDMLLVLEASDSFTFRKVPVKFPEGNIFTSTSQIRKTTLNNKAVFSIGFTGDSLRYYQLIKLTGDSLNYIL